MSSSDAAVLERVKAIFGGETEVFAATASPLFTLANARSRGFKTFVVEMPASAVSAFLTAVSDFFLKT